MKRRRANAQAPYLQLDGDTPRAAFPASYRPGFFERVFHFFFQIEQDKKICRTKNHAARQPHQEALFSAHAYSPIQSADIGASHLKEIQQALKDWKSATAYFESVSDPALIDYAVFEMEAAQKRYVYLLQAARSKSQRSI